MQYKIKKIGQSKRDVIDALRIARERAENYVEAQLATMGAAVTPAKRVELVLASMRAIGVTAKTCPECGYPLLRTRRLCVTCGTDELTPVEISARFSDTETEHAEPNVERIAAFIERRLEAYPEDVFIPGGSSRDAIAADALRKVLPVIAADIRQGKWRDE